MDLRRLDRDDEFLYRAKAWMKNQLDDEREERQRTVNSLNLLGRE